MMTIPSLTALRCLDASVRHASFTAAAREVHLTQGAVSHQILGLEAQLGVPLFIRQRSGLKLTPAGQAYWLDVSGALRQLERATQNMVMHRGNAGVLNLCVASSFATYWLMPRLAGFVAAHPEVTLNLSTQIGAVDFSTSPHDAAIEYSDGAQPELNAEKVLPLVLRPYASPHLLAQRRAKRRAGGGTPQSQHKAELVAVLKAGPLMRHTTVAQAWPGWLQAAGMAHAAIDEQLASGPRYDLLSMALNGAIAGLGIALLPDYMAAHAVVSGQLKKLSDVAWTADKAYYIRFPAWKADLLALARFRAWLKTTSTFN